MSEMLIVAPTKGLTTEENSFFPSLTLQRVLQEAVCTTQEDRSHKKKKKKKMRGGATLISYTHVTLKSHVNTSGTPVFLSVVLSAQLCFRSGCFQCGRGPLVADLFHLLSSFLSFYFF